MLSSRYAAGLGYAPQLFTGRYDFAPQNSLADLYQPAPAPAPAPRAPAAMPSLTTGTGALSGSYQGGMPDGGGDGGGGRGNADIGSTAQGGVTGLGPNPGFPSGHLGTVGALAGAALGIGFGVPGLGLAGGALGTLADVYGLNSDLQAMGMPQSVTFGPAALSNATFGLAGTSALSQFNTEVARDRDAPQGVFGDTFGGEVSAGNAIADAISAAQAAGQGPPSAPDNPTTADWGSFDGGSVGGGGNPGSGGDASQGGSAGDASSDGAGGMGWMMGGYTGGGADGMVNPYEPAGTVHEGEVVIPAHQVQRYGLEPLMALVRGDMPQNALAGMMRGPAPTSANALLSQIRYG